MTGHDDGSASPEPVGRVRRKLGSWLAVRAAIILATVAAGLLATGGCGGSAGDRAPDFSLVGADLELVSLDGLLESNDAVVIVFYRGFF